MYVSRIKKKYTLLLCPGKYTMIIKLLLSIRDVQVNFVSIYCTVNVQCVHMGNGIRRLQKIDFKQL